MPVFLDCPFDSAWVSKLLTASSGSAVNWFAVGQNGDFYAASPFVLAKISRNGETRPRQRLAVLSMLIIFFIRAFSFCLSQATSLFWLATFQPLDFGMAMLRRLY